MGKRKVKVKPNPPGSPAAIPMVQTTIGARGTLLLPGATSNLGGLQQTFSRLSLEAASISPPDPTPSPQPGASRLCGKPSESLQFSLQTSPGEGGLPLATSSPMTHLREASVRGSLAAVGGTSHGVSIERGAEDPVLYDTLWNKISSVEDLLQTKFTELFSKLDDISKCCMDLNTKQQECSKRQDDLEAQFSVFQAVQAKESLAVHRKLEYLENVSRKNNLRILNFPRSPLISPIDMVKRYFREVLGLPEDNLPPLTKAIYLETKTKSGVGGNEGRNQPELNLTEFLESSLDVITSKSTLLVTFALELDRNTILKLYFRNISQLFMGSSVRIFPDLASATQLRRKEFLALRQRVLALGGKFNLKFPCKCIISLLDVNYMFWDPKQLVTFLIGKEPTVLSTP